MHRSALAAALLAGSALAAPSAEPSPPDLAALANGIVHVADAPSPGLPGKAFTAWTLVSAPVPRLCALVQDYAAYASYMPNTKSALAVGGGEGYVLVDMTLALPLGQEKKYRLRLEQQQPESAQCKLAWRLVPAGLAAADTIADTTGYWLFTPVSGDNGKTLVEYHVYADPGPVPFGFGWIVDMMSKRSLPRTLEALRAQAGK
ncbi:SRPBCC family protein [Pseudoduganella violaceinigra]|uniref:SRPBCC family protein n=1 Tax=Pseudoduganella violaceinigra TaxID=246602 RepID=UPI0003FD2229|nr:SRPBCC family protein [Pseudoduganella violaceinigra]